MTSSAKAELDRPSRVACSDLLDGIFYGPFKYVLTCTAETFPSVTGNDACPQTSTGFEMEPFER